MAELDAFGADWRRDDLPFARNKKEFRAFEAFDEALQAAQSDDKGQLTANVNAAAKVAMSLSSSSGIKHVVRRLCLVSKDKLMDKMMHKETSVYVIDSIMRHADKEKNEELRQKYERHLQLHLRNIFKRAIRNDATRSHLAEKFMNKILLKWKEKGWFANELQSIVDVISKAAPDLEQPEELQPTYGAKQEEDEPSPIAVPAGLDSSWLMGRSGATAKAGAPPTPAQPVFLGAPGTPGPDGFPMASRPMANNQVLYSVPSTPNFKVETILHSVPATPNVLNSVPATPRFNMCSMGMSVPATPNVGHIPQTPVQGRIPQTPVGNFMLGRIPSTPMAAAVPMTPAGGGALLTIPRTPGAGILGSVPQTPGAPGVAMPQTPGGFGTVPATPRAMPSTPAMGRIPSTPMAAGIPATPHLAVPATPHARIPATPIAKKEETAPVTPAAAFGGMTPAGFQPFSGGGQTRRLQPFSGQAMPSTPQGLAKVEHDMDMDQPVPSEEPPTVATYSASVPSAEPSVEQPVPSVEQPVPSAEPPSAEQPVPSVEQPVPSVGAAGVAPMLAAEEVPTLDVPQPGEELTAEVPSLSLPSVPSVPSSLASNASAGSEAKRRRLTVKLGEQSGREQTEK